MRKIDKILNYVESQGISLSVFECKAGLSNSYLNNTKKRGEDISAKMIEKIKENLKDEFYKIFPEVLKGDHKIVPEEQHPGNSQNINYGKLQSENEFLKERLGDKDAMIQTLQSEVESLKRLVDLQEKLLNSKETGDLPEPKQP